MISIIIPTYCNYGGQYGIENCVDALVRYTDMSDVELIVAANGCSPKHLQYLKKLDTRYPQIKQYILIVSNEPLGYAKAVNGAIQEAKGEYIVLLDDDAILLQQNKNAWLNRLTQPNNGSSIGITAVLLRRHNQYNCAMSWCMCVHRDVVASIGLLDEDFQHGIFADTDYSIRAYNAGFPITPVAKVTKQPGSTIDCLDYPIDHMYNTTLSILENLDASVAFNKQLLKEKWDNSLCIFSTRVSSESCQDSHITCVISTKGHYDDTLPLTLQSLLTQSRKPQKIIVYDDNEQPRALNTHSIYKSLFGALSDSNIPIQVLKGYGGSHWNQQHAQTIANDLIFKCNDNVIVMPNTLYELDRIFDSDNIGAVGGCCYTQDGPLPQTDLKHTVCDIDNCIQWHAPSTTDNKTVEYVQDAFMYRKGLGEYNARLSQSAYTADLQFTYDLRLKGYEIYFCPLANVRCLTDNPINQTAYAYDYNEYMRKCLEWGVKHIVLVNGVGDSIMAKPAVRNALEKNIKVVLHTNHPHIFEDLHTDNLIIRNVEQHLLDRRDDFSIYQWVVDHHWTGDLTGAYSYRWR